MLDKCKGEPHFYHSGCYGQMKQTSTADGLRCLQCHVSYAEITGNFYKGSFFSWEPIIGDKEAKIWDGQPLWNAKIYYDKAGAKLNASTVINGYFIHNKKGREGLYAMI